MYKVIIIIVIISFTLIQKQRKLTKYIVQVNIDLKIGCSHNNPAKKPARIRINKTATISKVPFNLKKYTISSDIYYYYIIIIIIIIIIKIYFSLAYSK